MAVNDLARAVALKALGADVAARLQLGERPDAIRANLLDEGFPPEIVDHVFAACERSHPVGNKRTIAAAVLAALLMIGVPLVAAVCGVWVAAATLPDSEPLPTEHELEAQARGGGSGADVPSLLAIPIGGITGFALGLALAFPAAKALSTWSLEGSIADDEGHD